MEYKTTYNPYLSHGFTNEGHLLTFLSQVMRTDAHSLLAPSSLTRRNIHLLRHAGGELEYFTSVTGADRRAQLQQQVLEALRGVSVECLRYDYVFISPYAYDGEILEHFSELATETLPAIWKANCPVKGQEDMFLDNTFLMVLHADLGRSTEDTFLLKAVRLYKI